MVYGEENLAFVYASTLFLQGQCQRIAPAVVERGVVGSPTQQHIDSREQEDEGDSAEDEVSKGHVLISVFLMGRIVPISYRRLNGLLTPSGRYLALASEFVPISSEITG